MGSRTSAADLSYGWIVKMAWLTLLVALGLTLTAPVMAMADSAHFNIAPQPLPQALKAFAAQALAVMRELAVDPAIVNVNGGAIALGHPIGATGAVLIGTVLDELERRDLKRGLVTMCAAGGMAPAIIIERV